MSELATNERVRSGALVLVVLGGTQATPLGAALRELRRHMRPLALYGVFGEMVEAPARVEIAGGGTYYNASLRGSTWRAPGHEFTVSELLHVCASAYASAGGAGGMTIRVVEIHGDEATAARVLDLYDFRLGSAAPVANAITRTGDVIGATAEGAISLAEGAGSAARGIGDAAAGLGEGTKSAGAVARAFPMLTFFGVAGLALGVLYLRVTK